MELAEEEFTGNLRNSARNSNWEFPENVRNSHSNAEFTKILEFTEQTWNSPRCNRDGLEFTKQHGIGRRVLGDMGRSRVTDYGAVVSEYSEREERREEREKGGLTATCLMALGSRLVLENRSRGVL